jgi:DNA-binding transcriptional ArsR family regulator
MSSQNLDLAEIGALIGDPARANILAALADGRALTATELAYVARVTPQTTSGHLSKLTEANLLALARQGRHRYYRLASPLVAQMLENIMAVAAVQLPPRRRLASRLDDAMRRARTCYDHLAGRLGVGLAEALAARGWIMLSEDGGEVTADGMRLLADFGALPLPRPGSRRPFCRPCLDWSERRWHIAGGVGAGLCRRAFERGWIERQRDSRALLVTVAGREGFADTFGLALDQLPQDRAAA